MRFEGRRGGESVAPTMPLLPWKGYRAGAGGVGLGANPGDFTRKIKRIKINANETTK
jgi:hypothetical protein